MYPQYWTTSIGGNFMKYSYEYKVIVRFKYQSPVNWVHISFLCLF